MPIVTIFGASYCRAEEVAGQIADKLGYRRVEGEVLEWASQRFGVPVGKLLRAMEGGPSIFNRFTREKERHVAYLKVAMAEQFRGDNMVYLGYGGHLVPQELNHVLKVCLVASQDHRVAQAKEGGASEKEALRLIKKDDEERRQWVQYLLDRGPWDQSLYDIKLPMHSLTLDQAVDLILENLDKEVVRRSGNSEQAGEDFAVAAWVNVALEDKGHHVDVVAREGHITITISDHVLRLGHLEEELKRIARAVPGVEEVVTRVGPNFNQPNIMPYFNLDVELPSKVLLVDDEREFVQTLSERLEMRRMGSAVAFDGEQALSIVQDDEPEVMVLDLRMPGIDGLDVLRRVKKEHPAVEVIVLTGHGTEKDEKQANELGAFAYLQKPVDIERLTQTIKRAYEKVKRTKEGGSSEGEQGE